MRNLKFAILGLLNRKPMSGYDIAQEFNQALSEFWTANHSQIYPELKKLMGEGLIDYEIQISGEVLEKKVYSINKKGKQEFQNWLEIDAPMEATPKDIFRLRLYFPNQLDLETRKQLINSQLLQHQLRLKHLQSNQ